MARLFAAMIRAGGAWFKNARFERPSLDSRAAVLDLARTPLERLLLSEGDGAALSR